ncbi:MAG: c-type cytochrome [Betaproteobacteria bacterium]|nr:c-type cytochrome [Betaproteobacteria bacterium]
MKFAMIGITALAALYSVGQVAAADGKVVYEKSCAGCHKAFPKAPKLGDKAAWAPLLKKGPEALIASVIKGKAPMPPRGGAANDADAKAAVEYMIDAAK